MENNKKKILIDEDFLEDKMTYEMLVNMPSDESIKILEGGKEAFEERGEIYG